MSIQNEQQTVEQMIRIFCATKHGTKNSLCEACTDLLLYARSRLDHCPFGDEKPACRNCTVHCYQPDMRERITAVMRFAGPRMLKKHPLKTLRHLICKRSGQIVRRL
jgi:hypothetical protein